MEVGRNIKTAVEDKLRSKSLILRPQLYAKLISDSKGYDVERKCSIAKSYGVLKPKAE